MRTEGYEVTFCGTQWFLVEQQPELMDDEDDGKCDFNKQTIYINGDLHSHRKSLALVHEMLHVICDSVGLEDDEEIVRQLEHGVLELINVFPERFKK